MRRKRDRARTVAREKLRRILKAQLDVLQRRGITQAQVARRLADQGGNKTNVFRLFAVDDRLASVPFSLERFCVEAEVSEHNAHEMKSLVPLAGITFDRLSSHARTNAPN